MKMSVVNVTPEIAQSWLDGKGKNRRVTNYHVSRIAQQIKDGKWVLNGETICFDESGKLLDGQHRLSAIVEAGISVPVAVVMGVNDPNAFKTYDAVARVRGAHQIADMMGVKDSANAAACARVVMAYESSKDMDDFSTRLVEGRGGPMPDEVAEKSKEIESEVEEAKGLVSYSFLKTTGSPSLFLAALVLFNRINPVATASFCHKLRTGVVDDECDPCLMLRDRLLSGRAGRNDKQWKVAMMAMTIKAFNVHARGGRIGVLRLRNDEKFPRIIGGKE